LIARSDRFKHARRDVLGVHASERTLALFTDAPRASACVDDPSFRHDGISLQSYR